MEFITHIDLTEKELTFYNAYIEAVYFTDTGDIDQPENDVELACDFERESLIDCLAFYSRVSCYLSDGQIVQAGHDFWLIRNGHGAGFWGGDWPKHRGKFTKLAESFGEAYPVFMEA